MSDKNTTAKRAPQVASGDGPRPGLRPGTRAWARAQPTADAPAAALPEAEPDHHLQEAGGDVAGAEGATVDDSAANAQPLSDHGDDADAQASQTRSAQRLADWLATPMKTTTHGTTQLKPSAVAAFDSRALLLSRP